MKDLEVRTYPDPCLRVRARTVEDFTTDLSEIISSMSDIMYVSQGIGLAATQVGLDLRILVVDTGEGKRNFINPEILEKSKKKTSMEEGCLSLPEVLAKISRPEKIKVRAQDEGGEVFVEDFDGLMAKVLQHEIDHLCGRLLIDYLDPIRCFMAKRKLGRRKRCKAVKK